MRFLLLAIMGVLLCSSAALGGDVFDIDLFLGWGGCYRPMTWMPVEVGVTSRLEEPFEGVLTVSSKQDGLTTLTVGHRFVVTNDLRFETPLATKVAFAADKCVVQIADTRGRLQYELAKEIWGNNPQEQLLTAVREQDLLIGHVGGWRLGLTALGKETRCVAGYETGKVYVENKVPRMVPWDWTGFAALDVLVLYDPDWNELRTEQCEAIADWVHNGGRLLVVLGGHPLPEGNPIAEMLPFVIGPAKAVELSRGTLSRVGIETQAGERCSCWPLSEKAGYVGDAVVKAADGTAVWGLSEVGFGCVAVLGVDPANVSGMAKEGDRDFWISQLRSVLDELPEEEPRPRKVYKGMPGMMPGMMGAGFMKRPGSSRWTDCRTIEAKGSGDEDEEDQYYGQGYEVGRAGLGLNRVLEHLLTIPQLRPLSIWWVILLLGMLAVLLGPVDYILLKRMDRQPLTWLTSSVCIAVFTLGAYFGVHLLRSGKMQLRSVSVVDFVEAGDGGFCGWSTTYSGIFAPKTRAYELDGLEEHQWWSAIAPTEETLWGYRHETASRQLYCLQHDGGNLPHSVPINIWSMQCLLTECRVASVPIKAEVVREPNEVYVRIENMSDGEMEGGYVRFAGNQVARFGPVGARGVEEFRVALSKAGDWGKRLGTRGEDYYYSHGRQRPSSTFQGDTAFFATGTLGRTKGIERYLAKGAAVVCVKYRPDEGLFTVRKHACDVNHIQLVRLVVFPEQAGGVRVSGRL